MRFFQPAYCRFLGNKEIRISRFLHNNSAALTVIRSSRLEVFYKKGERNKEGERERERERGRERGREGGRETDRQRETERETVRDRERYTY